MSKEKAKICIESALSEFGNYQDCYRIKPEPKFRPQHFVKDTRIELLNVHGKGFKFIIPED